jgi:hypothetical protein
MKRSAIRRIALGLAIAAVFPVAAQAKPISSDRYLPAHSQGIIVPGEIPYLSQGVGVDPSYFGGSASQASSKSVVIPYLSQGRGVTPAELGFASSRGPDDRVFSKATSVGVTPVESDDSIQWKPYVVTGFALALLLAMGGVTYAMRHRRLSPA